jgi:hypothetical protein
MFSLCLRITLCSTRTAEGRTTDMTQTYSGKRVGGCTPAVQPK